MSGTLAEGPARPGKSCTVPPGRLGVSVRASMTSCSAQSHAGRRRLWRRPGVLEAGTRPPARPEPWPGALRHHVPQAMRRRSGACVTVSPLDGGWPGRLEQSANRNLALHGTAAQTRDTGRRREIRRVLCVVRHGKTQFARCQGRRGIHRGHGHLPRLRAGRPLYLAVEDTAHQFLHLRLRLLHQPPVLQRAACALHRRGGGETHAWLLPAQLYRGPVPQLRHHQQSGLHDGAGGGRGAQPACGARLPRLHPPENHSRRGPAADGGSRQICRQAQHQYRTADRSQPRRAGAGEEHRRHQALDGPHAPAHRRGARGEKGAALRPGRAEHAGDRGRGRQLRPRRSCR